MLDHARISYEILASHVLNAVFDLDYRIPKPSDLRQQLHEKKVLAMPVEYTEKGDYVTDDMNGFLNYVRLNGIKTIMYAYVFYSAEDVEAHFKVSSADRSFFRKDAIHKEQAVLNRRHDLPDAPQKPDDFSQYQLYCQYVQAAVDLENPKQISLYAIHHGKVIACSVTDEWLDRLSLPDAKTIREVCLKSASYSGDIEGLLAFRFIYDTAEMPEQSAEMLDTVEDITPETDSASPKAEESVPDSVEDITPETDSAPQETEESVPDTVEDITPETDSAPQETEESVPDSVEDITPETDSAPQKTEESVPDTVEDITPETDSASQETEESAPDTVEDITPETDSASQETEESVPDSVEDITPETDSASQETEESVPDTVEDITPEQPVAAEESAPASSVPDLASGEPQKDPVSRKKKKKKGFLRNLRERNGNGKKSAGS